MNSGKNSQLAFWICFFCTLAAVGTHVYLTNHHYSFKYGQVANESICNVSETINCNRTTASAYSEVMGIPVAIFGGLINFALLCLLVAFRFPVVSDETRQGLGGPIKLIALGIFATSLVMGGLSYFVLHTICPACTLAYALSLVVLVTAWMITSEHPLFSSGNLKLYPILAVGLVAAAFFFHHNTLRQYGGKERIEFMELQLDDWKNASVKTITPVEPIVMNPNPSAKMKMVEFADFLCGHCANAYPVIHNFVKAHPDVEFSFQAWPLDGECNSAIPNAEGTRCLLARVSHCAGQQGKPWKTQSWIFENQRDLLSKDQVKAKLKQEIPNLGLDSDALMTCVDSEAAREAIRAQSKLGADLNINGTPSLFVNGKKVSAGFSIPLLEMIYQEVTR